MTRFSAVGANWSWRCALLSSNSWRTLAMCSLAVSACRSILPPRTSNFASRLRMVLTTDLCCSNATTSEARCSSGASRAYLSTAPPAQRAKTTIFEISTPRAACHCAPATRKECPPKTCSPTSLRGCPSQQDMPRTACIPQPLALQFSSDLETNMVADESIHQSPELQQKVTQLELGFPRFLPLPE